MRMDSHIAYDYTKKASDARVSQRRDEHRWQRRLMHTNSCIATVVLIKRLRVVSHSTRRTSMAIAIHAHKLPYNLQVYERGIECACVATQRCTLVHNLNISGVSFHPNAPNAWPPCATYHTRRIKRVQRSNQEKQQDE